MLSLAPLRSRKSSTVMCCSPPRVPATVSNPPGFVFESEILIEAARQGFSTVAVDIPTIYGSVLRRPSHFRPVADVTRIVLMVAGKLLARGMDPVGLWRSLTLERQRAVLRHTAID